MNDYYHIITAKAERKELDAKLEQWRLEKAILKERRSQQREYIRQWLRGLPRKLTLPRPLVRSRSEG